MYSRLFTGLKVASFCGADGVDSFTATRWKDEISKCHVMVMVHQVTLLFNLITLIFN
jgi:hypothetical protein